MMTNL